MPSAAHRFFRQIRKPTGPLRLNSVGRTDRGALLLKSVKMPTTIKRRLSSARNSVEQLRKSLVKLSETLKELEAQDSLGRFEITDLMGRFDQAGRLAEIVAKRRDDTLSEMRKL